MKIALDGLNFRFEIVVVGNFDKREAGGLGGFLEVRAFFHAVLDFGLGIAAFGEAGAKDIAGRIENVEVFDVVRAGNVCDGGDEITDGRGDEDHDPDMFGVGERVLEVDAAGAVARLAHRSGPEEFVVRFHLSECVLRDV